MNKYDALDRVIETQHWSGEGTTPGTGGGIELTCTQTEYDAFGNVLRQISYDRKDIVPPSSGAITGKAVPNADGTYGAPGASNAIITYTYNWYDAAKRLSATAFFGTNSLAATPSVDSLFTNGPAPAYDRSAPPTWVCTGGG